MIEIVAQKVKRLLAGTLLYARNSVMEVMREAAVFAASRIRSPGCSHSLVVAIVS